MSLSFLSVCSGIEAVTVATAPLGWRAAAYSEIEKFPCALLKHRHPNTPNLGDMTKFHEWPKLSIDLLVGGTPCQSFSVAGLRKGLADPRGNLALTFLALADRYRPRWVLWENVPGVLSDKGNAFGQFLAGLAELGYGWSYRVLDAQFFGVPQRRRRVFVVGHIGDWQPAAAVLLEPASLRWDSPPSRKAGERPAGTLSARAEGGGGLGTDTELDGGIISPQYSGVDTYNASLDGDIAHTIPAGAGPGRAPHVMALAQSLRADGFDASEDGTGQGTPLVPEIAWALQERDSKGADSKGADSSTKAGHLIPVAFDCKRGSEAGEKSPTLRAMGSKESHANAGGQVAVAIHENQRGEISENLTAGSLKVGGGKPGQGYPAIHHKMAVRRLTVKECSRLQGFPDDYLELNYANAEEAHASQILHELWRKTGKITREGWRPSIVASLLTPEILLSGVHVGWVSWAVAAECADSRRKIPGENYCEENFVRALREAWAARHSPYRRESFEQCARQLGRSLSELPLEIPQAREVLRNSKLWQEAQRTWPLRYAFSKKEARSADQSLNPDGPRYKALGNSMAVPCIRWIAERIQIVHENLPQ